MRDAGAAALRVLCGRRINSGASREVFECMPLPGHVIKVERNDWGFQNITEWQVWERVRNNKATARWFAPCVYISPCGSVLIMQRTTEAADAQLPRKMPWFLDDFRRSNYGMLAGRLVCHDYGSNLLIERGGATQRTHDANWWS